MSSEKSANATCQKCGGAIADEYDDMDMCEDCVRETMKSIYKRFKRLYETMSKKSHYQVTVTAFNHEYFDADSTDRDTARERAEESPSADYSVESQRVERVGDEWQVSTTAYKHEYLDAEDEESAIDAADTPAFWDVQDIRAEEA